MKANLKKIAAYTGLALVPGGLVVAVYLLSKDYFIQRKHAINEEKKQIDGMIHQLVNCDWCVSLLLAGGGRMLKEHLEHHHDCSEEFAIKVVAEAFARHDRLRKRGSDEVDKSDRSY